MILVTGATGKVGSETVRLLTSSHQPVRAFVRDTARAPAASEVVAGDFDDLHSVNLATRDVDTVVLVSPAVPHQETAVIDAAVHNGVQHIVKITSKASADSPVDRRRGQAQIEAHLKASGIAHTLLRSNAFMQNLLALAPMVKQTDRFVMSAGDGQVGMIDARDVAAVAAVIAADPAAYAGQTFSPTGPALISYTDIAAELSDLLGRTVQYRKITPADHLDLMITAGLPEPVAQSNSQAFGLIADGDAAWTTDDVESVTGSQPRDLHTFLAEHLAAFR